MTVEQHGTWRMIKGSRILNGEVKETYRWLGESVPLGKTTTITLLFNYKSRKCDRVVLSVCWKVSSYWQEQIYTDIDAIQCAPFDSKRPSVTKCPECRRNFQSQRARAKADWRMRGSAPVSSSALTDLKLLKIPGSGSLRPSIAKARLSFLFERCHFDQPRPLISMAL